METEIEVEDGHARLAFVGDLTIYSASEAKRSLLDAIHRYRDLEVDLSAVGEFDTAGVQVLILAKRSASTGGQELRLRGHSACVLELIDLYDLAGYFGDPLVLAAADKVDGMGRRA